MRIAVTQSAIVVRAPAKINLFLEVLGKRPDGYHDIATLMVAVRLFDTLAFQEEPDGAIVLETKHPDLTTVTDNLIVRAARLLQQSTGCKRGARIRLAKRIPMAAGLAGGSTDAAATLAGLNQLWQLGLPDAELASMSGNLGSDIPFFFHTPAAWCTGRGEIVTPVVPGRLLDIVLVCPAMGLSTAEVYQGMKMTGDSPPRSGDEIREALHAGDVEGIGRRLFNRLEKPARELCPAVGQWLDRLAEHSPAGQLMSGSGSSLFAVCRDTGEANRLVRAISPRANEEQCNLYLVRSCV